MLDLLKVIVGGLLTLGGALLGGYLVRRWEKEKWLLDHEAKDCVDCIELLWRSKPPWTKEYLKEHGWESEDLNGRLQTLQLIPARMASIMLYQSHRGEDIGELERARKRIIKEIDQVRAAPVEEKQGEKVRDSHELPEAMEQTESAVETYLLRVKDLQKAPQDDLISKVRALICGRQSGSLP